MIRHLRGISDPFQVNHERYLVTSCVVTKSIMIQSSKASVVEVLGSASLASKTAIIRTCIDVVETVMLRVRVMHYLGG